MQDVRDGIVSRSIWAIGKLKRVQSNRDGGANVVLYKSLKNLHDFQIYAFMCAYLYIHKK